VPSWLRSLLWVDSAGSYDAFLSYSWKSDSEVAPVVQSVIQHFLCPWYKLRAKNVFRDLSCLPAGSSLETELFERLDRSKHLIVLASPEAAVSHGMEIEARHWFSCEREGQVLIIVTAGDDKTWDEICDHLLPPAVRSNLTTEPLWVPIQARRSEILADPSNQELRGELVEDLKQILLRLYPGRDWGQLRGEERSQRRQAIGLMSGLALLFLVLASAAVGFAWYAQRQRVIAESRQFAAQAQQNLEIDPAISLPFAIRAVRRFGTEEAEIALNAALSASKLRVILKPGGYVFTAAFSPDGKRVVTASADHTPRVWDAESGRLLATLTGHQDGVPAAAFSPDGKRVVTASDDKTARVWDAESGQSLATLTGHQASVRTAVFSPDGKRVVTASEDHTARVWDAESGRSLATLTGHEFQVNTAAFSRDGKRAVTAGDDETARVWDVESGRLCDGFLLHTKQG
jgi:WD40 repeat protein